jgi:hypothetical protein
MNPDAGKARQPQGVPRADRFAVRAQRRSDARYARWQDRQREKARTGRTTYLDRWAVREQRRSDIRQEIFQETRRFDQLVPHGEVSAPGGSTAAISVYQAGAYWLRWWRGPVPGNSGGGGPFLMLCLLVTELIWWLVFRRAYVVHVRIDNYPPVKVRARLPDQLAAYRAATQLAIRFQAGGPAVLKTQWTDTAPGT